MSLATSFGQVTLAATILLATYGTWMALTPPNPSVTSETSPHDSLRVLNLTSTFTVKMSLAPLWFLALHTSALIWYYPNIPSSILRNGAKNKINANLITWSAATTIPLALIICAGIPLRLVPYASLGKNFTFTLMEPDRLVTTGIYEYVQHPSYIGILILLICNVALLIRMDGMLSCWIPPRWYKALRNAYLVLAPFVLSMVLLGIRTRVREEENMLQARFGPDWETWHASTARFIPGLL